MDSRLWLALAGIALCASGVFSYPVPESSEKPSNDTSSKRTSDPNAGQEVDKKEKETKEEIKEEPKPAIQPPLNAHLPVVSTAHKYMLESSDMEHRLTVVINREIGIGGCSAPEQQEESKDAKPPGKEAETTETLTSCECEAYRSLVEKVIGLHCLPNMKAAAVDPGIMMGCALNAGKVEIRLAIRFKSKQCVDNCKKCSDGTDCNKQKKEKVLIDFEELFNKIIKEKNLQWQITEIAKLDAGEFMNAIGGCNMCQQQPASCPAACGCPQTYTAQECPANVPQQCCNQQPAAAPAQGEVQMNQIVVAPAPVPPTTSASQPVPAPVPCSGTACMMGIPVVQANICAPHCPSMCAPSCMPSCCNGGAGKRMLPFVKNSR